MADLHLLRIKKKRVDAKEEIVYHRNTASL